MNFIDKLLIVSLFILGLLLWMTEPTNVLNMHWLLTFSIARIIGTVFIIISIYWWRTHQNIKKENHEK